MRSVVAKSASSGNGGRKASSPPPQPSSKGTTKHGTPRLRGVRTYYGLAAGGELIRFDDYHNREAAIREGSVRRVSAHEAREIESRGTMAIPLSAKLTRTQVFPAPGPEAPKVAEPPTPYDGSTTMVGTDRRLIEVYLILERLATDLSKMQSLLSGLLK